eukprot:4668953-Amphidinium_carterae.1
MQRGPCSGILLCIGVCTILQQHLLSASTPTPDSSATMSSHTMCVLHEVIRLTGPTLDVHHLVPISCSTCAKPMSPLWDAKCNAV